MPQTFFCNFPYFRNYDLIRLISCHWQPCILRFCILTNSLFSINTSLGLQVPVAIAKFSGLVISYSLPPAGNPRCMPPISSL